MRSFLFCTFGQGPGESLNMIEDGAAWTPPVACLPPQRRDSVASFGAAAPALPVPPPSPSPSLLTAPDLAPSAVAGSSPLFPSCRRRRRGHVHRTSSSDNAAPPSLEDFPPESAEDEEDNDGADSIIDVDQGLPGEARGGGMEPPVPASA